MDLHRMDYRSAIAQGPALSQVNADALVLVLAPEHTTVANPVLDGLIKEALDSGDFALKAGRTLYLHRPAGLKAPRVVLVAAANAQAKSLRAAVAKGVSALKDSAAVHVHRAADVKFENISVRHSGGCAIQG